MVGQLCFLLPLPRRSFLATVAPREREDMLAKVRAFLDERETLEISDLARLMPATARPLQ